MTGRISVFLALCVLGAAVLAAIALRGSESQADHLSLVPSFHVDIGSSFLPTSTGNIYVEDPNSDGDASDQLMTVPPITACVRRDVDVNNFVPPATQIVTDIIIQDAQEMLGADVRINFDPSLIQVFNTNITPFTAASSGTGFTGQKVGLLNLPVDPFSGGTHRDISIGFNIDNAHGAAFLGGTYNGDRTFARSSESGPNVDGGVSFPDDRNAGQASDGGVFLRITWRLQPASAGQDVLIDLTTAGPSFTGGGVITQGSDFFALTKEDPGFTQEKITLGEDDLFDGVISVNKDIPSPCPPAATTPTPTITATPTPECGITLTQDDPADELVGGDHKVTATVTIPQGIECKNLVIWVRGGPNAVVDAQNPAPDEAFVSGLTKNGPLSLTYTSNGKRGEDEISGCIAPSVGACEKKPVSVFKTWVLPTPTPGPTSTPTTTATPGPGTPTATPGPGTPTAVAGAGSVPSTGNPGAAGGSGSDWPLYALAASLLLVAVSGSGLLWMSRRRIAWPWRRNQSGG